mgnify:FL=1
MRLTLKRFSFECMGSYCEIQLYDQSRVNAKNLTRRLITEASRIERKYSSDISKSFVSEMNFSAGNKLGIKIDRETKTLFNYALDCFEKSDGLYDITAGALNKIWNFDSREAPANSEIEALLPHIGLHKLKWRRSRLYLPSNMRVDFGQIIKEYAVDTVANLARDLGVQHGLVNLGGDFAVIGAQPDDKSWTVGIANPQIPNSLLAKLDLLEGGVATSGDFANPFMLKGKPHTTILNPKTGLPCSGLRAISVAAERCTSAGFLAKSSLLLEEKQGLEQLSDAKVTFAAMDRNGQIQGSGVQVN